MTPPPATVWFSRKDEPLDPALATSSRSPDSCRISPSVGAVSSRPPSASSTCSRLSRKDVLRNRVGSTSGKKIAFPISPCVSGYAPVEIDDALTRVTVG